MSPPVLLLVRSSSGFVALALILAALRRPLLGSGSGSRVVSFAIMAVTNAVVPSSSRGARNASPAG